MNLELLHHSRDQIPDRVDATLSLPPALAVAKKTPAKGEATTKTSKSKAANQVSFNRRGTYVAVGYADGTVAVYDVLSRTIGGIYRLAAAQEQPEATASEMEEARLARASYNHPSPTLGVSYLSWSRRSRTLLAGAVGNAEVRLIDTTHPSGPEDCSLGEKKDEKEKSDGRGDDEDGQSSTADSTEKEASRSSSFRKSDNTIVHHRKPRSLETVRMVAGAEVDSTPVKRKNHQSHTATDLSKTKRFPSLIFKLPSPVVSTLQVHPKDTSAGIATLGDGSLVAFWVPLEAWEDLGLENVPKVKVATIYQQESSQVTCASFDQHGDRVYMATSDGKLLGLEVATVFNTLASTAEEVPQMRPGFAINIPGGAAAWQIKVSSGGAKIIVNSADAAIRLYSSKECWMTPEEVDKPVWVYQDVAKIKFTACDFSGNGEYVLGAANGSDSYELFIWNVSDGALVDKLTGASIEISSVAWHPTRSFLAVASSDGLVDIWGPRINWTAFAPDFQALKQNIEYVEGEDEFDVTSKTNEGKEGPIVEKTEDLDVDVLTVDPISVFASDSEDETEVFKFETQVKRTFGLMNT